MVGTEVEADAFASLLLSGASASWLDGPGGERRQRHGMG